MSVLLRPFWGTPHGCRLYTLCTYQPRFCPESKCMGPFHTHYPHYVTVRHQNDSTANFRHCWPDDTVSRRVSLTALFRTADMHVYFEGWIWAKVVSYLEVVTVKNVKMYKTVILRFPFFFFWLCLDLSTVPEPLTEHV